MNARSFRSVPTPVDGSQLPTAPQPPSTYWAWGNLELLSSKFRRCCIVGGREPQTRHLDFVTTLIEEFEDPRLVTLSGMARGIDTAVHRESLRHQIPTIGVIASGFDHFYPCENYLLAKEIVKAGGLLISEHSPATPARRYFPKRNRLLAAWSDLTAVIQASERSGSLHTAHWALRLEKRLFVVPHFPGERKSQGNQILLDREHAHPLWSAESLRIQWLDLRLRSDRQRQLV